MVARGLELAALKPEWLASFWNGCLKGFGSETGRFETPKSLFLKLCGAIVLAAGSSKAL